MKAIAAILAVLSLAGCASLRHPSAYPLPGGYAYSSPKAMDDGIPVSSIEGDLLDPAGMERLEAFFERLKGGAFGEIHSVLLAYRGDLVLEEYFPGYRFYGPRTEFGSDDLHHLASVTKSITSLCVGIALDDGAIGSLDQPFLDFYPSVKVADREKKEGVTIRHLLTMTAGLSWDESSRPYTDLRNDVVRLHDSPDPLKFCLSLPVSREPGDRWAYSGALPNLLGDIIERATGKDLERFARERLYAPLGITRAEWVRLNGGFVYASGDASLRPRDMLKIGLLVLGGGSYGGKRIVSESYIRSSMERSAAAGPGMGYGFMWWLPELEGDAREKVGPVWMANGWGDQYIIALPKRELVLVVTGGNYVPNHPPVESSVLLGLIAAIL